MKKIIPIVAVIILVAGGSFFGGMKYGQSNTSSSGFPGGDSRQNASGTFPGGVINRGGANLISGEIIAKDENSITLKLSSGGSKIIFYSGSTTIQKTTSGGAADLTVGKTVSVSGKTNDDGSVTAQSIQLRPAITPSP